MTCINVYQVSLGMRRACQPGTNLELGVTSFPKKNPQRNPRTSKVTYPHHIFFNSGAFWLFPCPLNPLCACVVITIFDGNVPGAGRGHDLLSARDAAGLQGRHRAGHLRRSDGLPQFLDRRYGCRHHIYRFDSDRTITSNRG